MPVHELFKNQQSINTAQIIVCNTTGQTVFNREYSRVGRNFSKEINLGAVARGIYFITIIADGERVVRCLVLQ